MPSRFHPPIGLDLAQTAKMISRAMDEAMTAAGGSLPVWRILFSLKTLRLNNQSELATAVGIQGPTLTHHLNAMEADGLLIRRRDPDNRRVHLVEVTDSGEQLFRRMRAAAVAFDRRLRTGLTDEDTAQFAAVLATLRANVGRRLDIPA
jgi:MarR family transcriptional regulator for hemolysin